MLTLTFDVNSYRADSHYRDHDRDVACDGVRDAVTPYGSYGVGHDVVRCRARRGTLSRATLYGVARDVAREVTDLAVAVVVAVAAVADDCTRDAVRRDHGGIK